MITIKNITIKNFMSSGQVTQSIVFNDKDLVLVLGENLDLGGNDSRNGVGKTTLINAISYALYDSALTKIKKDNLVNKTNGKNMMVTLEFIKDGVEYKIVRGRRSNVFKFLIGGDPLLDDDTNEAQGDGRITQQELERILGMSHNMFKQIVALNTYNEPFLAMRASDQREIIEQLLGITKLSEKAEILTKLLKETRDNIKEEEFKISAITEANKRIENNIQSLERKDRLWDKTHSTAIAETQAGLDTLLSLDTEDEISKHNIIAKITEEERKLKSYNKELKGYNSQIKNYTKILNSSMDNLKLTVENQCHTCGQEMHDDKTQEIIDKLNADKLSATAKLEEYNELLKQVEDKIQLLEIEEKPSVFYDTIDKAYNHKTSTDSLSNMLDKLNSEKNPFSDQIVQLSTQGLQEVNFEKLNNMTSLRDHQEFLQKLLTSKDSFIRRKIIDQNLSYLNARLESYLTKIGLPHDVKFMSDLTVEITEHGRNLDFDNLSRGERTRLILSLSWAFRDVYESLNNPINLLMIDELLDSGLDTNGVEAALGVLKNMARETNRNIFLISHRDELIGRTTSTLNVVKEGGFTAFSMSSD